jgi:hypothetical protein
MVIYKGKNVLVDKTGKRILPANYQAMRRPSQNLIAVKKKNKWGYVDVNNEVKIKLQYQEASIFTDGLAIVKLKNKNLLIDNKGNVKLKIKKQNIQFLGNELLVIDNANHKNLCDKNFNIIVSDIDEIKPYKDNLLQIEKVGKMAYFDFAFKKIIWQEDGFTSN